MDPTAAAVLSSWRFDVPLVGMLCAAAWLYIRGWRKLHRELPHKYTLERLFAFLTGLGILLLAVASPLDAFAGLLLQVHMIQHLLLIMLAPSLIWLGQPVVPVLRGLPGRILQDGMGPFLASKGLRHLGRAVTHPLVGWMSLTWAIVFWHFPKWYDLGLQSPGWHKMEHASFFGAALLFWWPVIEVWPSRPVWPRWAMIPYLVLADLVNTGLSAWLVFSTHVVYRTYEVAPRLAGISALDDQATAGVIMWVPGSLAYLLPAFLLTMSALNRRSRNAVPIRPLRQLTVERRRPWDLLRMPLLGRAMRHRHFRVILQTLLFTLAIAIVADGFRGPQVTPLNLAGTLPWIYWRGFAVVALLVGGNFFCMACPFTLPRSIGRRWLPARHGWPVQLRSKWFAAGLLVVFFWAYDALALWDSPWWTAWIVVGYFVSAFLVDGLFQGASFCKYVCPIGQFHFVSSLASPLEVKARSATICRSCETHDCIRGNENRRGCEMQLFVPTKRGNFDCTFCLDCVHACPSDNVGIFAVAPASALTASRASSGIGAISKRRDIASLTTIFVWGALVSAAAMVGPVMLRLHEMHARTGLRSMLPVTTLFYAVSLLVTPAILTWVCAKLGRRLGRVGESAWEVACAFTFSLVPLGFSMWTAHFLWHLISSWGAITPVLARFLNASTSVAGQSGVIPAWLTPLQLLLLDAGLLLTLYIGWRIARQRTLTDGRATGLLIPWAMLAIAYYAASAWVLLQPMQMRGMVMGL